MDIIKGDIVELRGREGLYHVDMVAEHFETIIASSYDNNDEKAFEAKFSMVSKMWTRSTEKYQEDYRRRVNIESAMTALVGELDLKEEEDRNVLGKISKIFNRRNIKLTVSMK